MVVYKPLFAVITHMFQNGTCAIYIKFAAFVNVVQMFGNSWPFSPEQVGYLFLCQPNGFIFQPHFQLDRFIRLV